MKSRKNGQNSSAHEWNTILGVVEKIHTLDLCEN